MVEDCIRVAEKERKTSNVVEGDDPRNDATNYIHGSGTRWVFYIRVGG